MGRIQAGADTAKHRKACEPSSHECALIYKARVTLYFEAESEADACDAVSETLRQHIRTLSEHPENEQLVDWHYSNNIDPKPATMLEIRSLEYT